MTVRKFSLMAVVLSVCFQSAVFAQVKVGDIFPDWTAGYMDIHHINTGRGECMFAILPDGTTLMIDAGETGAGSGTAYARPDESRSPGEWMSRYMLHMMRPLPEKKLDYILLTHFHGDHMGAVQLSKKKSDKGDYMLTGVTEVGDMIPFGKIVDRNWPDYDFPRPMSNSPNMQNYIRFINCHVAGAGAKAEQFQVGSTQQFTLLKQADKYPEFEIRNLAANGVVWTGVRDNVHNYLPPLETISRGDFPDDNYCSAAIRISYGRFDYYNGGDLLNSHAFGTWRDIETPVGLAAGPLDVCEANHHAANNAMGEAFLKAVRPRVIVIQAYGINLPNTATYQRMLEYWKVYPGERDIFTTNLMEANELVIGEQRTAYLKSKQGHIVVRVHPGGDRYDIYILDDTAESFAVKAIHGTYESR